MRIEISTDFPIPVAPAKGGKPPLYPFADLPVGGSFALPWAFASRIGDAAKQWKRRHPGWNYCTRKEGDQIRVWRTA